MHLLLAAISGVLLALVFPRYDAWWLAPVVLTPLTIALVQEYVPLRRFLLGWVMGLVFWAMTCNWIASVLEVHGGMGFWGGWGAFALFCVLKSLHYGVYSLLGGILVRHWYGPPAMALLWAGLERTQEPLTGFGWLMLGNAGTEIPVALRLAPYTGVYGISFVFALMAISLALILLRKPRIYTAWLLFVLLPVFLPKVPEGLKTTGSAVAVQPNFPVLSDWTSELYRDQKELLTSLSLAAGQGKQPGLILWPETPTPIFFGTDADLQGRVRELTTTLQAPILFGSIARTATGQALNTAQFVGAKGETGGRYDKVFLVPFGEYVPELFSWVNQVSGEVGAYTPGQKIVTFPVDGRWIGAFICYESAVPHHVREFARSGAELFVNLSNDGYFFETAAREQHLQLVRMRAAENRRWILRVTNNGITVAIDPAGVVRQSFPGFQAMAGTLNFGWRADLTPYTRYGDWFAWLGLVIAAACLFATQWPNYLPESVRAERRSA
jgi:apolipoprotein N-acyltransferase